MATANAVAQKLALPADAWAISFQSRLGKAKWLQPYTDKLLVEWASAGVQSVDVICPAFATDCIETLEEIQGENQELFYTPAASALVMCPVLMIGPTIST